MGETNTEQYENKEEKRVEDNGLVKQLREALDNQKKQLRELQLENTAHRLAKVYPDADNEEVIKKAREFISEGKDPEASVLLALHKSNKLIMEKDQQEKGQNQTNPENQETQQNPEGQEVQEIGSGEVSLSGNSANLDLTKTEDKKPEEMSEEELLAELRKAEQAGELSV